MPASSVTCRHCNASLSATHEGPCPKCGGEGKRIAGSASNRLDFSDTVGWETRREFYEKNPVALAIVCLLTVASSGVGLILEGGAGAAVGLALGLVSFVLSPKAVTLVREHRQG